MTTQNAIWLALMGITFVLWAFFWFSTLFTLGKISKQRRVDQGAGYFGSIPITLRVFGEFLTAKPHKFARRRVLFFTALVFAVIFFRIVFLPPP